MAAMASASRGVAGLIMGKAFSLPLSGQQLNQLLQIIDRPVPVGSVAGGVARPRQVALHTKLCYSRTDNVTWIAVKFFNYINNNKL